MISERVKLLAVGSVGAVAAASANATIYKQNSLNLVVGSSAISTFLDFETGASSTNSSSLPGYDIYFGFGDSYESTEKPLVSSTNNWRVGISGSGSAQVLKLDAGDTLGASSWTTFHYLEYKGAGAWSGGTAGEVKYITLITPKFKHLNRHRLRPGGGRKPGRVFSRTRASA
jgi:hypothetical protein